MAGQGGLRVGVFHPATQHSWQTALAFQEGDQLAWYATATFYDPARWPYRIEGLLPRRFSTGLHREFLRQRPAFLDPAHVRAFGTLEWFGSAVGRFGQNRLGARFHRLASERFAGEIAQLARREPVDVLWGYDGAALEAFRWAKSNGLRCVLDQTTAHPVYQNRAMAKEYRLHPNFFNRPHAPLEREVIARQNEELALADLVVVGSDFCAQTLRDNGCAADKIRVVPYGYDETLFPQVQPARLPVSGRPARFLFAGPIAPTKGAAYLLEAFRAIAPERATLILVGPLQIPRATFARYAEHVTHLPQPADDDPIGHFLVADGLVFPSLFEGGGRVLSDALGAGLGIIQSATADIPTVHGRNGIVLDRFSIEALSQALEQALEQPERLARWGQESWQMRPERSWNTYRRMIRRVVAAA